jgi:hypothetical protein
VGPVGVDSTREIDSGDGETEDRDVDRKKTTDLCCKNRPLQRPPSGVIYPFFVEGVNVSVLEPDPQSRLLCDLFRMIGTRAEAIWSVTLRKGEGIR